MSQSPAAPVKLTQTPSILVFDSGVGGLSVAREIQQRLPQVSLVYASDNAFFPYGTKGEAELIARVDLVIRTLLDRYAVDILVIACNTASTLALPHLRSQLSLPIVGVVPAIKPAATQSKTGVIGLLATPATVARPYTHELIRE
ncbi:MAG TPA: glutamate racemase, partial [Cellvibrio sp.]